MPAPNLKEVENGIYELENTESSKSGYILLAALHICRNQMLGQSAPQPQIAAYSEAPAPVVSEIVGEYGDSDFLKAVAGIPASDAWAVMDELMDTLQVVNARIYGSVMMKLGRI